MSLQAILQFGDNDNKKYDKQYLLTDFKCYFVRHHNEARPDSSPRCEHMELVVEAPGRQDLNLYEWYVDRSSMTGRVLVALAAPGPYQPEAWKEVYFDNAYCYSIAEEYNIDETVCRRLKVQVVAQKVTVDGVEYINKI